MDSQSIPAEAIGYARIPVNGALRIERCGLTGWLVQINGSDPRVMGQAAAFSNANDLIDWVRQSLRASIEAQG